jgi:hypothetical protein
VNVAVQYVTPRCIAALQHRFYIQGVQNNLNKVGLRNRSEDCAAQNAVRQIDNDIHFVLPESDQ